MSEVKKNIRLSSRQEQLKLLTLVPSSWPREKVAFEFGVSERQVKEARALMSSSGILPEVPQPKKGNKPLSEEITAAVKHFYTDSEFVRIMPGCKQVVSHRTEDGKKAYEAQRLILCNLSELYGHFRSSNPYMAAKVGVAKLCELRPKYCTTVSAAGTHSVCAQFTKISSL